MDYKSNNFEKIRHERGLSNRDFAKQIGLGETVYSKLKKGELPLGEKTMKTLRFAFPEYNIDWLLYDKGERYKREDQQPVYDIDNPNFFMELVKGVKEHPVVNSPSFHNETEEESPFIDLGNGQYNMIIPLVEQAAQAGFVTGWGDAEYIAKLPSHSIIVDRYHRGKYYAFRVIGDSMEDGSIGSIPERSIVTGREIKRDLWRSKFHITKFKYYVIVHQDGIMVKQITEHDTEKGIITCHSLNEKYKDFDLHLDEIKMILNVVNISIPA